MLSKASKDEIARARGGALLVFPEERLGKTFPLVYHVINHGQSHEQLHQHQRGSGV